MNILFLDYDGVVNTPRFEKDETGKWICRYGNPLDGKVNDTNAVQWVSEFCEKYGYKIVVSSSWRSDPKYADYLRNAGLRESIDIIGRTPVRHTTRGEEITEWLNTCGYEVENYIIFDDDNDMNEHIDHLIQPTQNGFGVTEFSDAVIKHNSGVTKR